MNANAERCANLVEIQPTTGHLALREHIVTASRCFYGIRTITKVIHQSNLEEEFYNDSDQDAEQNARTTFLDQNTLGGLKAALTQLSLTGEQAVYEISKHCQFSEDEIIDERI